MRLARQRQPAPRRRILGWGFCPSGYARGARAAAQGFRRLVGLLPPARLPRLQFVTLLSLLLRPMSRGSVPPQTERRQSGRKCFDSRENACRCRSILRRRPVALPAGRGNHVLSADSTSSGKTADHGRQEETVAVVEGRSETAPRDWQTLPIRKPCRGGLGKRPHNRQSLARLRARKSLR